MRLPNSKVSNVYQTRRWKEIGSTTRILRCLELHSEDNLIQRLLYSIYVYNNISQLRASKLKSAYTSAPLFKDQASHLWFVAAVIASQKLY